MKKNQLLKRLKNVYNKEEKFPICTRFQCSRVMKN